MEFGGSFHLCSFPMRQNLYFCKFHFKRLYSMCQCCNIPVALFIREQNPPHTRTRLMTFPKAYARPVHQKLDTWISMSRWIYFTPCWDATSVLTIINEAKSNVTEAGPLFLSKVPSIKFPWELSKWQTFLGTKELRVQ